VSKESNLRLEIGELYSDLDRYEAAVTQFDLWVAVHDDDRDLPAALNGRCWARALAGRDLDKALADCNTAVRLTRRSADVLDSRGLVHLRRGEFDRAIADYDAALAQKPTTAWSLYGRGLAELRTGAKAQGDADLAAAAVVAPHLAERAAKLGLSP
jgi:tetratricopeptide (TPR) repeat protein